MEPSHLKCNLKDLNNKKKHGEHLHNGHTPADTNTFIANGNHNGSTGSLDKSSPAYMCAPVTPIKQNSTPIGTPVGVSRPLTLLLRRNHPLGLKLDLKDSLERKILNLELKKNQSISEKFLEPKKFKKTKFRPKFLLKLKNFTA